MFGPPQPTLPYEQLQNNGLNRPPSYQAKAASEEIIEIGEQRSKHSGLKEAIINGPWTPRGRDDSQLHWKPMTLRVPMLGGFVLISISLIAVLEILAYISSAQGNRNGGGLAFAADVDALSTLSRFALLYLPTIIAVFYSMLWSWVDLDVKRLEPWFQLSNPAGAAAKDSILLQYPFDFLPFVPITACRRKHWGVFLAGTVMLMIFWVVTPLQSAIFNTGTVVRSINTTMANNGFLVPVENQTNMLNANFLNTAYGISWLSQRLPPFVAPDFAVLPFSPIATNNDTLPSETWSVKTNAYFTNLTCTPANVSQRSRGYTFDNGKGCSVADLALADTIFSTRYMINYIGYHNSPLLDWTLQNPNCSSEFSNNFLALFASNSSRTSRGVFSNLTALFCEPTYQVRETLVQVNASNHAVVHVSPTRNSASSDIATIFNTTNFEYLIGIGVGDQRSNFPDSALIEQYPRLQKYDITWPLSLLVGFAVALHPLSIDSLADPSILQQAFERAHQLLFGVAFSTLTQSRSTESPTNLLSGLRQDTPGAIILVRPISLIVEVALGIISILAILLWYYSHQRSSNLPRDPASIADLMTLIQQEDLTKAPFKDDGTLNVSTLTDRLATRTYNLSILPFPEKYGSAGICEEHPAIDDRTVRSRNTQTSQTSRGDDEKLISPVQPKELKLSVGIPFVFILLSAIGVLVFVYSWSERNQGISLPSENSIVLSLIENYIPTTFATLIEPAWVILNRLLCLLQPFEELQRGNAKVATTLDVKYTSIPPPLVIWRAFRSRHVLLATVCLVVVSTNVLAVSLSGLLFESPAMVSFRTDTTQSLEPTFNGLRIRRDGDSDGGPPVTYDDHFYVALSNFTQGTSLPPWIDQEFFYLPFDVPQAPSVSSSGTTLYTQGYRGTTTGFGAKVTCDELSSEKAIRFDTSQDGSKLQFSTTLTSSNGSSVTCVRSRFPSDPVDDTKSGLNKFTGNLSALEVMQTMFAHGGLDDGDTCSSTLLTGWVRGAMVLNTSNVDFTFLACTPKLVIADFEVYVDADGRIINSTQNGAAFENTQSYFKGNSSESALFTQASTLMSPGEVGDFAWHNDTFTSDWVNALLTTMANSSDLVDPAASVPNAKDVAPLIERLYRQLFSILLGLNTDIFTEAPEKTTRPVDILAIESRLFVSQPMFFLSVAILSLHLIVAIIYYSSRPKRFLPRMPTSIAATMAYVMASRALEDFGENSLLETKSQEPTYGYGRFIDNEGQTHVGIERQRYVVPLKSHNPAIKKRRPWQWKKAEDASQPRTWI